jgi:pseudaminic acid synthase
MNNPEFSISGRLIGESYPPYIIAEMSANHNGNIKNAFAIIDMAKRCGADAVKMQTYTPDTITLDSNNDEFMIKDGLWAGRTLYELYDWAHTPWHWHKALFDYASKVGIAIFSTPFDNTAVDLLEELNAPAYKIASFECIDLPLIKRVAKTGKPMMISTGMANEREISEAIETSLKNGASGLTILHCVSVYPAQADEYNLRTLSDIKLKFGVNVGLSDHTLDTTTSIAAIALGASIIEKHVTLDRTAGGPDDSFSLEEKQLYQLCKSAKCTWEALGKVNYSRTESEKGNVKFRRSLYFVRAKRNGDIIVESDIRSVRPGYGISPKYLSLVIGSKVICDVEKNTPVTEDVIDIEISKNSYKL